MGNKFKKKLHSVNAQAAHEAAPIAEVTENYRLIVSAKLEQIIRKYCFNCPNNEWSGVLFYKVEGTFETSLTITCIDMLLMDVGTGVHTQFDESPEIATFMFENDYIPSNGVYTGLIHSHNRMAAFFSGEDDATITKEGTDRNHYVSLVVCNAGLYVARITRKMETTVNSHITSVITEGYHTFKNQEVILSTKAEERDDVVTKTNVKQYDFKITVEEGHDDTDIYGARMCDLLLNPRKGGSNVTYRIPSQYTPVNTSFIREYATPGASEPSLFPYEDFQDGDWLPRKTIPVSQAAKVTITPKKQNIYEMFSDKPNFNPDNVVVNKELVDEMIVQLLTGSVIPNPMIEVAKIDSVKQYELFSTYFKPIGTTAGKLFTDFAATFISFLIESKVEDESLKPFYERDEIEALYAYNIIKTIKQNHISNVYIWEYIKLLKVYLPKFMISKLDK